MTAAVMHTDITGIILVGGKSRRMGRDKALLPVDGIPIIERILNLFRSEFPQTLLVGDRGERFSSYGLPVVADLYPGSSLGGLYTGLYQTATPYVFVASCDLPFPNEAILRHLCTLRDGYDAVVTSTAVGYEPLFALYAKSCLGPIKTQLDRGDCCAHAYFPQIRARIIPHAGLAHLDRDGRAFLNVNTPEDFARTGAAP